MTRRCSPHRQYGDHRHRAEAELALTARTTARLPVDVAGRLRALVAVDASCLVDLLSYLEPRPSDLRPLRTRADLQDQVERA